MRIGALIIVVSLFGYPARSQRPVEVAGKTAIRVLIVDGFSNHDWKRTTWMVKHILEETGRFEVTVSTAPSTADSLSRTSWDPAFEKYAVVIQNTNNIQDTTLRWPGRVEQRLEAYVRGGGGLYVLHSANNAFASWLQYDTIIGLGWRPRGYGYALQLDTADRITRIPPGQGEGTNHGERFDAVIHIVNRHPINRGYPNVGERLLWSCTGMPAARRRILPFCRRLQIVSPVGSFRWNGWSDMEKAGYMLPVWGIYGRETSTR